MNQVYLLNIEKLNSDIVYRQKFDEMSILRQQKISKYYFRKDKMLSLGAGLVLNYGLQKYGLSEEFVKIDVNENGKPYLSDQCNSNINFNLSHSGNFVLGAFGTDELGVDIEKVTDINTDIAKKFLFSSEYNLIMNTEKTMQNDVFFRLWVLKESFMKAVGMGMSLPLNEFQILINSEPKVIHTLNQKQYYFKEFEIPYYKIAVCSTNDNFSDLINITNNIF